MIALFNVLADTNVTDVLDIVRDLSNKTSVDQNGTSMQLGKAILPFVVKLLYIFVIHRLLLAFFQTK